MTDTDFEGFYRAQTAPLVAFLCVQGAALPVAARAAQDAMAVAGSWTARFGAGVRVPDLRTWTYRIALDGLAGWAEPEDPIPNPLLADEPARDQPAAGLDRLAELSPRQRRVVAMAMASCSAGEIGYELMLPAYKVRRTLRYAGKLLGATTHDAVEARLRDLRAELVGALDPALDLDAGLAEAPRVLAQTSGLGSRPPVPPCGAPVPAVPPDAVNAPAPGGLREYAAALAARDDSYRRAERTRFPVAELAAVRLGALFSFHADRFRRDAERSGYRGSRFDFPAADARAYVGALARDIACASPMFDAIRSSGSRSGTGPARLAYHLESSLEHDDPHTNEVSYDGIDLALGLAEFRRGALNLALRALPPHHGQTSDLAETLRRSAFDTARVTEQLRSLSSDLSEAESTLPDGVYVDMTRDFAAHEGYNADLIHGIGAAQDTLSPFG
ncbi:hypothetical protein ACFWBF_08695 [Streptomyces sp. NPDC060028]|uniref:hypothetical protein n=1 Tax=Streptomyces sp. NPDC060028 TaxID=3347041 RepID=UPI0036ADF0E0